MHALFLALALAQVPVEVMLGSAESNLKAGKLDRAERSLAEAKKAYPNEGRVDYFFGLLHAQRERPEPAIAAFREAIGKSPELRDAHLNLALQYDVLGQYDAADTAYGAATKRFAKDAELWAEWGTNLILRKQYARAERALRTALSLKPAEPELTADLAFSVLRQDRAAEAVTLFEQALGAGVAEPEVRRQYGDALAGAGRLAEAETVFSALLAQQPKDQGVLFRRSKVREALGNRVGAEADAAVLTSIRNAKTSDGGPKK